ncbi:hypothetical protein ACLOJK_000115 [Asimina triloba]
MATDAEEEAPLLMAAICKVGVEIGPGAMPRAPASSIKAADLEVVAAMSSGGDVSGSEDIPIKGSTARVPKKMAQFHGRGSINAQARVEGSLLTSQATEWRRGPTLGVRATLGMSIESSWRSMESRAIQESVALGLEPPLDVEGRDPGELMLSKFLPNV